MHAVEAQQVCWTVPTPSKHWVQYLHVPIFTDEYLLTITATEKLACRISSDNDDLVHIDTQQLEQVVPAFVSMIMM